MSIFIKGTLFPMKTNDKVQSTETKNKVFLELGKSLKSLRIAKDKSQEVLGFEAEVDRTYISQIERGVANPSVLTLANICHSLGITLADLFVSVTSTVAADGSRRSNQAKPTLTPKKSRLR